ncbi:hypothetical protein [Saccharopolyspora sp. 5N708]
MARWHWCRQAADGVVILRSFRLNLSMAASSSSVVVLVLTIVQLGAV